MWSSSEAELRDVNVSWRLLTGTGDNLYPPWKWKKGKAIHVQALKVPGGQRCRDNRHMKVARWSKLRTGPKGIVRLEELCRWEISVTPPGTEPGIFRLVAQCLNQLCHLVPSPWEYIARKTVEMGWRIKSVGNWEKEETRKTAGLRTWMKKMHGELRVHGRLIDHRYSSWRNDVWWWGLCWSVRQSRLVGFCELSN